MKLKEKLKALGFIELFKGQFLKRDLYVYVYIKYNKIKEIQVSREWELKEFYNYTEYLTKVNHLLNQIESILYSEGE